jgi:hypothetical protein
VNPIFTNENIGTALAEATVKLADHLKATNHVDHRTAQTIRSVVATASSALNGAQKLLATGDTETALQALGIADGACRLVTGLVLQPNNPVTIEMAAPFLAKEGK